MMGHLKEVWNSIGAAVAELFNRHFVPVSDNEAITHTSDKNTP